jgi:hypothetical protein
MGLHSGPLREHCCCAHFTDRETEGPQQQGQGHTVVESEFNRTEVSMPIAAPRGERNLGRMKLIGFQFQKWSVCVCVCVCV